jgi:hypothetical protein
MTALEFGLGLVLLGVGGYFALRLLLGRGVFGFFDADYCDACGRRARKVHYFYSATSGKRASVGDTCCLPTLESLTFDIPWAINGIKDLKEKGQYERRWEPVQKHNRRRGGLL